MAKRKLDTMGVTIRMGAISEVFNTFNRNFVYVNFKEDRATGVWDKAYENLRLHSRDRYTDRKRAA